MTFSVPAHARSQRVERLPDRLVVAFQPQPRQPRDLPLVALRIHLQNRDGGRVFADVLVDADDHALVLIDLQLIAVAGVGDLLLEEARFQRRDHAADLVNPAEIVVNRASVWLVSASTK